MKTQVVAIFCLIVLSSALGCRSSLPLPNDRAVRLVEECDALSPLPSPVGYVAYGQSSTFWSSVSATVFPEHRDDRRNLLMVAFIDPGVAPQEALLVVPSSETGGSRLVHAQFKARILEDGQTVPAEFYEGNLDRQAFARLEPVWRSMTASARWPLRNEVLSLDPGVATLRQPAKVQFDYWGNHSFSQGTTSASREGSCTAEFVSVVQELIRFVHARDGGERQLLRDEALRRIERLSVRTQLMDPDPCADGACHSR